MTAQEYSHQLLLIERDNPTEVLLPTLRTGHSRANEMYMRSALKRVPSGGTTPSRATTTEGERLIHLSTRNRAGEEAWAAADDTLRALWRERTRLLGEMNKQSNLFHTCKTDEERAANSALVLSWWDDIQAAKAKIAHYEQHGTLPTPEQEGEDLPDNAALLSKKLNSLRARISQVKKKITDIAGLDEGTPGKQSKINAAEDDLKQLQFLAGKAAVKLKEYESAT